MPSNFIYTEKKFNYVYRITNTVERKYYYGVHSCNDLPRERIGVKYFSSSTDEIFLEDQKSNPSHYKYKIIKFFDTRKSAVKLEIFLHHKFDVKNHPAFYNKSNQTSDGFDISSVSFSEDHQKGLNNSQFGSFWIHNKEQKKNTKIKKDEEIPDGWKKGRICNWNRIENKEKKIIEKLKKKEIYEQERKQYAENLWQKFKLEKSSLREFAKKEYPYSHVSLFNLLKKYIPEYSN